MNKYILKTVIYCSTLLLQLPVWAAGGDSLFLKNSMNLPDKVFFNNVYQNQALSPFRPDAFSRGDIGVHYTYSDFKGLGFIQEGSSLNQYKIAAEGLTVDKNKIFWGNISYNNFRRKNVQWNNVYDYKRVGPYLLADSIGGNSQGEEYTLSGGLSIEYKKWVFGGEAGYTAGNNYRKSDPRPHATSTDLYVQISASYNLFKDYQGGISFNAGKYREKISISIEQDHGSHDFFPLRGFGLFNYRLFGAQQSNFSSLYEGQNYGAGAFFAPRNKNGLLGNIKFDYGFTNSNPGATNSPNPYTYKTYDISSGLGWQAYGEKTRLFVRFSYDYKLGKGIERLYYTISSESTPEKPTPIVSYHLLSANWFYTKKTTGVKLSGGYEWFSAKNVKWVTANIGYSTYGEKYFYPQYKMRFERIISSVELGGEFHTKGASSFVPRIGISYSPLQSSDKVLPEGNKVFDLSTLPNISYLEADLLGINASFTYQYKLKTLGSIYASAYASYLTDNNNSRCGAGFSVGVRY